jgi:hypothetical protein
MAWSLIQASKKLFVLGRKLATGRGLTLFNGYVLPPDFTSLEADTPSKDIMEAAVAAS